MNGLVMSIKRLLRPLIPDAVMARYRVQQHSLAVRSNVDVFVDGDREAKTWMAMTPDTYRIVTGMPRGAVGADCVALGEADEDLQRVVGFEDVEVAVRGFTLAPAMRRRKVAEPRVVPRSILAAEDAMDEIGGVPDNSGDIIRTYQRLQDAGRRIGLLPTVVDQLPDSPRVSVGGPAAVVFAAVPMHDIGGGSRAAQITFELLRCGYHVTYVSMYPTSESIDLGIRFIHPMLEQYRIGALPLSGLRTKVGSRIAIIEAPMAPFVAPTSELKDRGWRIVYDIIDDWTDPSLGGDWYNTDVEQSIVDLADGVVASALDLVRHGGSMGADPLLVPNAVNADVFGPSTSEMPDDLPSGRLIGYHGSLYGDWFDWRSLEAVATAFPTDTIVVIGDAGYERPMPPNVVFLGLKAQTDLPAYVQRFSVGIVPFKITDVTHAVSPLKVYEYLASGVAVAAPPLRALEGLDGVYTNEDLVDAVSVAMNAPRPNRIEALNRHSWHRRLKRIALSVGADEPSRTGASVKVVRRPPTHYARSHRRVRIE